MERVSVVTEEMLDAEALARANEKLADGATGIEHHPKPVLVTTPLVTRDTQSAEHPYGT